MISASIGACAFTVQARMPLDEILAEADRALYIDKSNRKKNRQK